MKVIILCLFILTAATFEIEQDGAKIPIEENTIHVRRREFVIKCIEDTFFLLASKRGNPTIEQHEHILKLKATSNAGSPDDFNLWAVADSFADQDEDDWRYNVMSPEIGLDAKERQQAKAFAEKYGIKTLPFGFVFCYIYIGPSVRRGRITVKHIDGKSFAEAENEYKLYVFEPQAETQMLQVDKLTVYRLVFLPDEI